MKEKTRTKARMRTIVIVAVMVAVMLMTGFTPASAATSEIPATGVSFPTSVSMKVGETRTLNMALNPSNTTYRTSIEWGNQTNGRFTVKANGFGTYWDQPSTVTLKGTSAGTGTLNNTVKVFDSKGNFIRKYDVRTTVTVTAVTQATTNKATTKKATTKATTKKTTKATTKKTTTKATTKKTTTKAASKNGNVSVGSAYTKLNKFRTSKKVWQWNSNNRTKTYFNTNSSNQLKPLKRDAALEKTAKLRAKEIATYYSHTRPNGSPNTTAYPKKYTYRGENIAYGQTSAREVTEQWKETNCSYKYQGHRRNMLNKRFTSVGIGCYKKGNTLYWVQCFGQ